MNYLVQVNLLRILFPVAVLVYIGLPVFFAIRFAIRYIKGKSCAVKIKYDEKEVLKNAQKSLQGKENIFLNNDLTMKVAHKICCLFLDDVRLCRFLEFLRVHSSVPDLRINKPIGKYYPSELYRTGCICYYSYGEIKYKCTSIGQGNAYDCSVSEASNRYDSHNCTVLNFEKENLQPLTGEEAVQFGIALCELCRQILNTPSAKAYAQLKDNIKYITYRYYLRYHRDDRCYRLRASKKEFQQLKKIQPEEFEISLNAVKDAFNPGVGIEYTARNPYYKEPPKPKKWY